MKFKACTCTTELLSFSPNQKHYNVHMCTLMHCNTNTHNPSVVSLKFKRRYTVQWLAGRLKATGTHSAQPQGSRQEWGWNTSAGCFYWPCFSWLFTTSSNDSRPLYIYIIHWTTCPLQCLFIDFDQLQCQRSPPSFMASLLLTSKHVSTNRFYWLKVLLPRLVYNIQ